MPKQNQRKHTNFGLCVEQQKTIECFKSIRVYDTALWQWLFDIPQAVQTSTQV